ncbi:phage holin family protein [Patescibacteria group bacterium]
MKLILQLLIGTLSVMIAAYIIPGVMVASFFTAFVVAVVLGVLNVFVKPVLLLLTLPINVLTLGLFTFVINVGLIFIADYLVDGFSVESILAALLFGLVMSFVNSFLNSLTK